METEISIILQSNRRFVIAGLGRNAMTTSEVS